MSTVLILNYQKRSHAWILHRLAWRLLFLCLLVAAFASWRHRAWLYQHARFLYFSWRCECFTVPAHLAAIRPGGNAWALPQNAAPLPDCWQQLNLLMGGQPPSPGQNILFLHERSSPAGHRRLVVLEIWKNGGQLGLELYASVVVPADPMTPWKPPRLAWHDCCNVGTVIDVFRGSADPTAIFPLSSVEMGQPDPAGPAHFTIAFTLAGIHGVVDGTLRDDDTVHLEVHDASTLANQLCAAGIDINLCHEILSDPRQDWVEAAVEPTLLPPDDNP